ncbi:MAG: SDR family oxidoreductase [Solirubrobacteraceae bacterium]
MSEPILVTGAASGIGAATAALLREQGLPVIGVDRLEADQVCDFTQPDAVAALIERLPARLGGIAHVAGIPGTHPPADVLDVNFLVPRRLSEALGERIDRGGAVVYVASVAAGRSQESVDPVLYPIDAAAHSWLRRSGLDGSATYDLTKKALVALAVRHARVWLSRGVRSVSVSPGPTETPILADFVETMGQDRIDGARAVLGRHGRPDDIAPVIAFLLGPGAGWINAVDLRLDGGLLGIR